MKEDLHQNSFSRIKVLSKRERKSKETADLNLERNIKRRKQFIEPDLVILSDKILVELMREKVTSEQEKLLVLN
jgi:hypothetical protein